MHSDRSSFARVKACGGYFVNWQKVQFQNTEGVSKITRPDILKEGVFALDIFLIGWDDSLLIMKMGTTFYKNTMTVIDKDVNQYHCIIQFLIPVKSRTRRLQS